MRYEFVISSIDSVPVGKRTPQNYSIFILKCYNLEVDLVDLVNVGVPLEILSLDLDLDIDRRLLMLLILPRI